MDRKSDWTLEEWGFESPQIQKAGDLETGQPAASFVNGDGLRVKVTYDRHGDMVSVCFSGPGLTAAALPHVAKLASDGRQVISDWVVAYSACRPADLRKQEAETRRLRSQLGAYADQVGLPPGWPLGDMVEGFAPPARPGRSAHSATFLAAQAKEYVERCVMGAEKVSAVARDLGMSQATFSTQLRAARRKGLLDGSPRRGEVQGALTPEAELLLSASTSTPGGTDGNRQAP